jgi:homoserine kinase
LSGAGPSIFAVVPAGVAPAVAAAGVAAWRDEGIVCEARICRLDPIGARVITR